MKAITGTLESFKSEKPSDILAPQLERSPEDPIVWPPPVPAEHRYLCRSCVFARRPSNDCFPPLLCYRFMLYSTHTLSVTEFPIVSRLQRYQFMKRMEEV